MRDSNLILIDFFQSFTTILFSDVSTNIPLEVRLSSRTIGKRKVQLVQYKISRKFCHLPFTADVRVCFLNILWRGRRIIPNDSRALDLSIRNAAKAAISSASSIKGIMEIRDRRCPIVRRFEMHLMSSILVICALMPSPISTGFQLM